MKPVTRPRLTPSKLKHWAEAIAFTLLLALAIAQQIANTAAAIRGQKPPFDTGSGMAHEAQPK